ncbi:transposase [Fusobacterium necrophorum]|nr:IS200/IS605 family element RNA-guided endonuclease TnpB [Fusobacterium necrophorum]AYZ72762.1 transposase [Fusobacterium necrophorum]AZW09241.1 transposase [Fusobacterium necrophorum subsp. necrophorum]SDB49593.1 putative transposase [Fusobacterium necrophorum]SQD10275.1 transposase, IS605 OrfB family [Fusobacterium necrophorum subsp. necrophorum]
MRQLKAYKFRMYPSEEQKIFFRKTFGCVRLVYNLMLHDRMKAFEERKGNSDKKIKYPTPANYKKEYEFLKEVDSLALANAQMNLEKAYKNFFRNKAIGFPKFKSKKNPVQSYTTNNQNGTVTIFENWVKLPKLKEVVKIKVHRNIEGIIKSATISCNGSGKYFISLLCETDIQELPKTYSSVGIDLGIQNIAILSTGEKIENLTFRKQVEKKLKREQRKLSKRFRNAKKSNKKLSEAKNYQKQRIKVAKIHEKIVNRRTDFLNKLSTYIIKNHDIICMEDLNTKGLLHNHKLAKSIADVSWASFVNKLEYKAKWYGKEIIKVDRVYPSSQICSVCGHRDGKKTLDIREWTCPICHAHHDRDINASKNILAEGLRRRETA